MCILYGNLLHYGVHSFSFQLCIMSIKKTLRYDLSQNSNIVNNVMTYPSTNLVLWVEAENIRSNFA